MTTRPSGQNLRDVGVLQVKNFQTGAAATGSNTAANDDNIRQNTEGDEYMTLAFTPKSATSKLKIDVVWWGTNSSASPLNLIGMLFRDSVPNALASVAKVFTANGNTEFIMFSHFMDSPGTSSTTFKVRVGGVSAGTSTFNGSAGVRKQGGRYASSITITEIAGE